MIFLAIDLQNGFIDNVSPKVIKVAQEEVRRAMRYNYDILFLEYWGYGPTIKEIKGLTKNYDKRVTVKKWSDDGGINVLDAIQEHNLSGKKIRVSGIYTDLCVHDTIRTLSEYSPSSEIFIRKDGCDSIYSNSFRKFKSYKNVKLIKE